MVLGADRSVCASVCVYVCFGGFLFPNESFFLLILFFLFSEA